MAINLNDNLKINVGNPIDSRYLNTGNTAYVSIDAVTATTLGGIAISQRYKGLTVLVDSGGTNVEFWFKNGVANSDLEEKKFASEQLIGDFITGATNLGYFEGLSGIQWLNLSGGGFGTDAGLYYSEYNWYYADAGGIIRIGAPEYSAPLRRTYINALRTKSWIWDVSTDAWIVSQNDVIANVGNSIIGSTYTGSGYTNVDWDEGTDPIPKSYYNGSVLVTAYGSLYTGITVTIGNPVYKDKSDQELHLRTIINDTPQFLKIQSDDNFIRFSGATSTLIGQNLGAGTYDIFTGKTGSTMYFRTLTPSGDTTITQNVDGSLTIYSSSDGSANAITGATNYSGGSGIYSGTTDRNLQLRSIVGSGNTTVTTVGGQIIIDSVGGSGAFTEDITVSIAAGKTFGKYENGDVIPASGKTANDVILLSLAEALDPTLTLGSSATDVIFGQSGKTVNVTFTYSINTVGASVSTAVLEWRRGNAGSWSGLTSDTGDTSYFHTVDDSVDRFNTAVINYRYTVVDTGGGSGQTTYNVTPEAYAVPTINPTYDALTTESYESDTLREIGNVDTTIEGGILSNRSLVNLIEYRIQRDDGSGYVTVASATSINALTKVINSYLDSAATSSATIIRYRIVVDDEYQNNNISAVYTINLRYASYFGYNTTDGALTSGQIVALHNEALLASRVRTVDPVTAAALEYTFISYPASYGNLTSVIMDGASPVLGSFDDTLSNVVVTNFYGETVSHRIYKSIDPGAFDDNELAFS